MIGINKGKAESGMGSAFFILKQREEAVCHPELGRVKIEKLTLRAFHRSLA